MLLFKYINPKKEKCLIKYRYTYGKISFKKKMSPSRHKLTFLIKFIDFSYLIASMLINKLISLLTIVMFI